MSDIAIQEVWRYLLINMIPLLILGVIILSLSIYASIVKSFKKIYIVLLFVLAILIIAYATSELLLFSIDINNKSFEEYLGDFEYSRVLGNRRDQIHLAYEPNTWVRSVSYFDLDSGEHSGVILYGKYSRWVINITVSP